MNTQDKLSFKKNLALVFDEDLSTRPYKWHNWADILIIVMIVLSTVAVFLGTFELSPALQRAMKVVDWVVMVFFTVEVSLRIWAADEIDPKYKGFKGRIKYCLSFYGLVDFLSTYPVWLSFIFPLMPVKLFQIFRVLRVARLFRVFRYMKAFRFLGEAVSSKKREMFVSLMFLIIVTIVLSFILFLVEHNANPDMVGNGWRSIVWSFAKYIGDPGKIVDEPLVTTGGRIISFLVGIMGIAIFAVPIGLLSSGFSEAIEKDSRSEELKDFRQRLLKAFKRIHSNDFRAYLGKDAVNSDGLNKYYFVPNMIPVTKLEVRGIKKEDVIDVVNEFPEFRLKNMASAMSAEEHPDDRLVVEHFPLNTDYGCKVDRGSNITIVCTTSLNEVGIGWFAYHLAKLGGFNYISKEMEADPEDGDSFYAIGNKIKVEGMTKEELEKDPRLYGKELKLYRLKYERRQAFLKDLEGMCGGENQWCIMLLSAIKNSSNTDDFHFSHAKKDGADPAVMDTNTYFGLFEAFRTLMQDEFQLSSVQTTRYPLLPSNLGYKLQKDGCQVNAFTIRVSSQLVCFDARVHAVLYRMAEVINGQLHGQGMIDADREDFAKQTFGYPEVEVKTER